MVQRIRRKAMFMAFSLIVSFSLSAQSGFGIAGGLIESDGYSLSYSVGQVFNTVIEDHDYYISQGLQHPTLLVIQGDMAAELLKNDSMFLVFPNPVSDELHIKLVNTRYEKYEAQVVNIFGKIVMKRRFDSDQLTLPMDDVDPGNYLVSILFGETDIKTFMIIKIR